MSGSEGARKKISRHSLSWEGRMPAGLIYMQRKIILVPLYGGGGDVCDGGFWQRLWKKRMQRQKAQQLLEE
jgi:hypothetical protein